MKIYLNDKWLYQANVSEEILDKTKYCFKEVLIPHTNIEMPEYYPDELSYQFKSVYFRELDLLNKESNKHYFLNFEGVGHKAKIYLNKQLVDTHTGGYSDFKLDITKYIKNGKNEIFVFVETDEKDNFPPFGHVIDFLTYGGIYRDVFLEVKNEYYFKNIYLHPRDVLKEQKLHVEYEINKTGTYHVNLKYIKDNREILIETYSQYLIKEVEKLSHEFSLWSLEKPNLHTFILEIDKGGKIIDRKEIRLGFREAIFTKDGFYLNGKRTKLLGLNRHQSYPYVGYAASKSMQEFDVYKLKETLGVNIVRTAHYPQSEHFLNACDEIGLLVFEEIPGWQHVGDEEWKNQVIKDVNDMIIKDRHHPSIVVWGVRVNESGDYHKLYSKTNILARNLDPYRQTSGVRFVSNSEFLEDVYGYNDFTYQSKNQAILDPIDVIGKDIPYLITEHSGHTYPVKKYDHESLRIEQVKRHLAIINQANSYDQISGAIGWVMADYQTHQDFGAGDGICYHGVLDQYRQPKDSAFVYFSQQDDKPMMHIVNQMQNGDYPGGFIPEIVILTNCDYVKIYRNDDLVDTYYPSEDYKHLINPPIILPDLMGNLMVTKEGLSFEKSEYLKTIFRRLLRKETIEEDIPQEDIDLAWKHYTYYVSNWGSKRVTYRFEGYKDNVLISTEYRGEYKDLVLNTKVFNSELDNQNHNDIGIIEVYITDQTNKRLNYSFDNLEIETSDNLELIGPKNRVLVAGSQLVLVRALKGKQGKVKIKMNNQVEEHIFEIIN